MYGGYFSIKPHEPCQVRKEAAISGKFYVKNTSIERLEVEDGSNFQKTSSRIVGNWNGPYLLKESDYMSYTALYRKFRPTKFSEIVGQDHITRTLKNQIIAGRVGHAYLLTGGRGTRKNHCC